MPLLLLRLLLRLMLTRVLLPMRLVVLPRRTVERGEEAEKGRKRMPLLPLLQLLPRMRRRRRPKSLPRRPPLPPLLLLLLLLMLKPPPLLLLLLLLLLLQMLRSRSRWRLTDEEREREGGKEKLLTSLLSFLLFSSLPLPLFCYLLFQNNQTVEQLEKAMVQNSWSEREREWGK